MKTIKIISVSLTVALALVLSINMGSTIAAFLDPAGSSTILPFAISGGLFAAGFIPMQPGLSFTGITVTELYSEFGTYIQTNQKTILQALVQKLKSQQFMTTIMTTDLEWRAAKAVIDDLVQGFQKKWTPKGTATFTPIAIPQRRHKFDFDFYPDDVFDSWIGFLADESKNRLEWPISRFMIDQMLIPKVNSNRELKLIGKGVYAAPEDDVAQATGLSMDGFCTILEKLRDAGTSNVNFFNDAATFEALTDDNIVDWMESFVDWIDELYQDVEMPIFCSRQIYKKYKRKYRDLYGEFTDYNAAKTDQVDFSLNRLQPLPSMSGRRLLFTTPKENFIRLLNRNDGASNIEVEKTHRLISVSADWHESVGFAMEEAIFGYVPEDESQSV